jgi:hypothetical protein
MMNIDELDSVGRKTCEWCFLPEGNSVAGDCMLAQKIALETFESRALAIANRSSRTTSHQIEQPVEEPRSLPQRISRAAAPAIGLLPVRSRCSGCRNFGHPLLGPRVDDGGRPR